ncbi:MULTISPECIES: hypothetical protein [Spirosoma]|uniref:Lacal_2735 family protein n=1 Tax=Spirosoma liriopis TaxID=2937440 RepID=A0ABT0HPS2_9BACT|nr:MULTISPECIES: hypothetical protein [Spirosoma]MCK8494159.1 hypothetical protein [Spirosoma liriopis]UHG89173.1 hypothetical protein LQ777_13060 [Spirosoma oryzicola]
MTKKQAEQFNDMLSTLRRIAKGYQSPGQLRKISQRQNRVDYTETLEGSYEKMQQEATECVKGVKTVAENL